MAEHFSGHFSTMAEEQHKAQRNTYSTREDDILRTVYDEKENWKAEDLANRYNEEIRAQNQNNHTDYPERKPIQIKTHVDKLVKENVLPNKFNRYEPKISSTVDHRVLQQVYEKRGRWTLDELTAKYNEAVTCRKEQIKDCIQKLIARGKTDDRIRRPRRGSDSSVDIDI